MGIFVNFLITVCIDYFKECVGYVWDDPLISGQNLPILGRVGCNLMSLISLGADLCRKPSCEASPPLIKTSRLVTVTLT